MKDILKSLDEKANKGAALKAGESAGASGSFFFFSKDNKFLIKTITREESQLMLSMVEDYVEHIKRGSLLAKIYGIFTIKSKFFADLDIILMQNTARLRDVKNKMMMFDLKGSLVNRSSKLDYNQLMNYYRVQYKPLAQNTRRLTHLLDLSMASDGISHRNTTDLPTNPNSSNTPTCGNVLKDVNMMRLNELMKHELLDKRVIQVQDSQKRDLFNMIQLDTLFLKRFNIMDYSLFIVIEKKEGDIESQRPNEFLSNDGSEIYHIGIIDYLQEWNQGKRNERMCKMFLGKDVKQISAINPIEY